VENVSVVVGAGVVVGVEDVVGANVGAAVVGNVVGADETSSMKKVCES